MIVLQSLGGSLEGCGKLAGGNTPGNRRRVPSRPGGAPDSSFRSFGSLGSLPVHSIIRPIGCSPPHTCAPGERKHFATEVRIPQECKIAKQSHLENAQPSFIKRDVSKIAFHPLPKTKPNPRYPSGLYGLNLDEMCYLCSEPKVLPMFRLHRCFSGAWHLAFGCFFSTHLQSFTGIYSHLQTPSPPGGYFSPEALRKPACAPKSADEAGSSQVPPNPT
jgi:hypothetical protein